MQNAGQQEAQERLRNQWEPNDPRMNDCLELSKKMDNILKCAKSDSDTGNPQCGGFYKPLELVEAMKEAASKIELLTEPESPANEAVEIKEENTHQ